MTTPSTGNGVEEIKPNPGSGNKHQHNGLRRINTCMYIIHYCCLILAHALTIVLLGLIRMILSVLIGLKFGMFTACQLHAFFIVR